MDLYKYQQVGVNFLTSKKRALLADAMGVGKSAQALRAINYLYAYPCLVLCPASLKINWEREIEKWVPGKTVSVINRVTDFKETDFVVINYDRITKNLEALGEYQFVGMIADESHMLKNYMAKRTKTAKVIAKDIPVKFLLTGTPVLNHPVDLISQLQILGRLDELGGWIGFTNKYLVKSYWGGFDKKKAKNLDELKTRLELFMLRRTKEEVLPELPGKQHITIPVVISNIKDYKTVSNALVTEYKLQGMNEAIALTKLTSLRKLAAMGKVKASIEWIESFVESDEKLVVFAHHRDVIRGVKEGLSFPVDTITGSTPMEERQRAVDAFQNNPESKVLILNIQAGGVGLTLTAASHVLFIELPWVPAILDQAIDRTHRIGQKKNVTIYYMMGEKTIDWAIYGTLKDKRLLVSQVIHNVTKKLIEAS